MPWVWVWVCCSVDVDEVDFSFSDGQDIRCAKLRRDGADRSQKEKEEDEWAKSLPARCAKSAGDESPEFNERTRHTGNTSYGGR